MTLREIIDNRLLLETKERNEITTSSRNEIINAINPDLNQRKRLNTFFLLLDKVKEKIPEMKDKEYIYNFYTSDSVDKNNNKITFARAEKDKTKIDVKIRESPKNHSLFYNVFVSGLPLIYAGVGKKTISSDKPSISQSIDGLAEILNNDEIFYLVMNKKSPTELGAEAEKEVQEAGKKAAEQKNIKTQDKRISSFVNEKGKFDTEKLKKNILYSFSYGVGATTKYNKNDKRSVNSADLNYTFNSKSIDIEVKRTFYKYPWKKTNPFIGNEVKQSLQGTLYPILRLLETTNGENKYSIGIYTRGFDGKKIDDTVYVDNTQDGVTKIGLDKFLLNKLKEENSIFKKSEETIAAYTDLSTKKVKRISNLEDFRNDFITPTLENIEKVITVNGDIERGMLSEGIVYDKIKEVGKNVKKNLTAAGAAIAMGSSKLDPNYKSFQNYQQNTKIERNYNQNQEMFKAAKKSLDSIIIFCKEYGLNNSLQKANSLLPLLNKKMAASVETKYFNY